MLGSLLNPSLICVRNNMRGLFHQNLRFNLKYERTWKLIGNDLGIYTIQLHNFEKSAIIECANDQHVHKEVIKVCFLFLCVVLSSLLIYSIVRYQNVNFHHVHIT